MLRLTRGLGALFALLLGLFGVPYALVVLGGNPLPGDLSGSAIRQALFTPDDGTILVGIITIVAWAAWSVFALSVLSELVTVVSRRRIRIRLPGLAGPQRLAAALLIAVVALVAVPQLAHPPPAVPSRASAAPAGASSSTLEPVASPAVPVVVEHDALPAAAPAADRSVRHTVRVGDDLWSLAEHYYGTGRDWRKIAAANPEVLSGGPDRLTPGWRLLIPGLDAPEVDVDQRTVTVRRGDTLSAIAERELGSLDQWRTIFRLNRAQLSDPDELSPGMRLVVPGLPPSATGVDEVPRARERAQPSPRPDVDPSTSPTEPAAPATPVPGATAPAPEAPAPEAPAPDAPASDAPAPAESAPTAPVNTAPATAPTVSRPSVGPISPETERVETQTAEAELVEGDDHVLALAGVGGLLAAGLVGGLALRRRLQLQLRPLGRRIPQPPPPAQAVEVVLGRRQRPLSLRTLDRAARAIAAHCRTTQSALPPLLFARVGDEEIELIFGAACPEAPVGFTVHGRSWRLSQADAGYLGSVPGLSEAGRPWPALVTLGRDDHHRLVLADLEALGLLQLSPGGSDAVSADGVLAAMGVELSFSPWADEMILTLVGSCPRLPAALGKHNVTRTDDLDALLTRLEQRAAVQREHRPQTVLGQHRIDPDLADPWAPEIVLINASMSPGQRSRLDAVVSTEPRVTTAAVVVGSGPAPWSYELGRPGEPQATLAPVGFLLTPQSLEPPEVDAVLDLVECTGSELTTPAPWWTDAAEHPDPPPDNVTFLGRRFGGWGTDEGTDTNTESGEGADVRTVTTVDRSVEHPTLQLLGPVELLGAAGDLPPRAGKQCLEYCAWLLENPGTTAQAMTQALVVAEGTRRSNMSRLRGWLGNDPAGQAYLPDAYTGRIMLHPSVSSDWQQLQILTIAGVDRASSDGLHAALALVRGAPLADAAPGQWHWAEELRTDMISCLRDIGVELANRALDQGDVDLARWAAARALVAAPGDEQLVAARIRTEHLAGNAAETERLTLQLAAQARTLGIDLDPETVTLLQRVMEGRVRARMA